MDETLKLTDLGGGIAELVLSQPAKKNALNAAMWKALPTLLKRAADMSDMRVLIVRGDGANFSSGADISEFGTLYATTESANAISADIAQAMDALAAFARPTVAVIRGTCVGGGCALALACDVRMADDTAKFAITPARLGLVYPYADIGRLIEIVGVAAAKDMLFSARLLDADTALSLGLIGYRFAPDDLEKSVQDYCQTLSARSPQALRVMKQMIATYQAGQSDGTDETMALFQSGFGSRDFQEGYRAFLEKRAPKF